MKNFATILAASLWTFWIGGFTFYLAVVVPIGGQQIGPDVQGEVTAIVSLVLNVGGILAGLGWLIPNWQTRRLRRYRQLCAATLLSTSLWLSLHRLDVIAKMEEQPMLLFESWTFYGVHRAYIWITLLQWLNAIAIFFAFEYARRNPVRNPAEQEQDSAQPQLVAAQPQPVTDL